MSLDRISLFSPAKLNLFLRVLHKEKSGFHSIASLIQAIDLGDRLDFTRNHCDALVQESGPPVSLDGDNLISRAAALFRKKSGVDDLFILCRFTKSIPLQGGLGGGSSNAATALYACNELSGRPCSIAQLQDWGGELGADVPFFFSSGSAYCSGRGEEIEEVTYPVDEIFSMPCYLAQPSFGLSTPAIYAASLPGSLPSRDPRRSLAQFMHGEFDFYNDLEDAACRYSPNCLYYLKTLRESGFSHVSLTGSGPCAFCFGRETAPVLSEIQFTRVYPLMKQSILWYSNERI